MASKCNRAIRWISTVYAVAGTWLCPATAMAAGPTTIVSSDGLVQVDIRPVTPLTASSFDTSTFSAFSGWTVSTSSSGSGSFTTSSYAAVIKTDSGGNVSRGGANFTSVYQSTIPPASSLQLVQVANTTGVAAAYAPPHLDPLVPDDNLPFYYTNKELATYQTNAKTITFSDNPGTGIANLANGPVSFTGKLYSADWNGNKTVTVHDGISWGYDMKLATAGKSSATFSSPNPTCPPATCTGIGSPGFTWGMGVNSGPSALTYQGAGTINPAIGKPFVIGTLDFFNGTISLISSVNTVNLDIDTAFGFGSTFGTAKHIAASLQLINTPNLGVSDAADADIVTFTAGGFTASFHTMEGKSASVQLLGLLSSNGILTGDKALEFPDTEPSGLTFSIAGFGKVTGDGFVTSVPEPPVYLLVLAGAFTIIQSKHFRKLKGLQST